MNPSDKDRVLKGEQVCPDGELDGAKGARKKHPIRKESKARNGEHLELMNTKGPGQQQGGICPARISLLGIGPGIFGVQK